MSCPIECVAGAGERRRKNDGQSNFYGVLKYEGLGTGLILICQAAALILGVDDRGWYPVRLH
jgi:hypothetical protein